MSDRTSTAGSGSERTAILPAKLDTASCAELAEAIAAHRGQDLDFDAGKVEFLGTLAAQMLLAAQRQWKAAGQTIRVVNPSVEMAAGARLLGLACILSAQGEAIR